jgi:hypothetical protein
MTLCADVSASAHRLQKTIITMLYDYGYQNNTPHSVGKMARMGAPTNSTGIAQIPRQTRISWNGRTVQMERKNGQWQPIDGKFVKHKHEGLTINILCHNKDPKLPKDYRLFE